MQLAHFQKLDHRVAGPGVDGVKHRQGRQTGIDVAVLLCLNNPAAQQIANPHQTIHVGPTGHQSCAQAGVLTG